MYFQQEKGTHPSAREAQGHPRPPGGPWDPDPQLSRPRLHAHMVSLSVSLSLTEPSVNDYRPTGFCPGTPRTFQEGTCSERRWQLIISLLLVAVGPGA